MPWYVILIQVLAAVSLAGGYLWTLRRDKTPSGAVATEDTEDTADVCGVCVVDLEIMLAWAEKQGHTDIKKALASLTIGQFLGVK